MTSSSSRHSNSIEYRPEIDGLRALAVLPVILFHAGFSGFSGGFVGVDVFFVISGYLITSILLKEIALGRFTLLGFYERRARRILPALFVVVAATVPFAAMWMPDAELANFARSLAAMSVFASNLFFWRNTDYFDPAAAEQPLLHTWSLAVEEQFYIFFPLFLLVAWRLGSRWLWMTLVAVTLGSLTLAQWGSVHHPAVNFYLLPTRAWELLTGALAAYWMSTGAQARDSKAVGRLSAILALLGVAMLLYAIFTFDETMPFPSVQTLFPVMGTALIILFATRHCLIGRILASGPLVAIGLLSYSAYLWHQPIFALFRLSPVQTTISQGWVYTGLIALVFLLATWSWHYVEAPFRDRHRVSRPRVFQSAAFGIATLASVGLALNIAFSPAPSATLSDIRDCEGIEFGASEVVCKRIGNGPRHVVLFGDSHVLPLLDAFDRNAEFTYSFVSVPGCPPLVGLERYDGIGNSSNCDRPGQIRGYADQVAAMQPETVILVGRWTLYMHGWQKKNVLQKRHHLMRLESGQEGLSPVEVVAAGLEATVGYFQRTSPMSRLYILEQVPDIQMYGHVKTVASSLGDAIPRQQIDAWDQDERQMLDSVAREGKLGILRTKQYFCTSTDCTIARGKDYYYLDDNHLSSSGARLLKDEFHKLALSRASEHLGQR